MSSKFEAEDEIGPAWVNPGAMNENQRRYLFSVNFSDSSRIALLIASRPTTAVLMIRVLEADE